MVRRRACCDHFLPPATHPTGPTKNSFHPQYITQLDLVDQCDSPRWLKVTTNHFKKAGCHIAPHDLLKGAKVFIWRASVRLALTHVPQTFCLNPWEIIPNNPFNFLRETILLGPIPDFSLQFYLQVWNPMGILRALFCVRHPHPEGSILIIQEILKFAIYPPWN